MTGRRRRRARRAQRRSAAYPRETIGNLNGTAETLGPLCGSCRVWLRRIKDAPDPANVSNPLL